MLPTKLASAAFLTVLASTANGQAPDIIHYTFDNGDAANSAVPGIGDGTPSVGIVFVPSTACTPGQQVEASGATPSQIDTGWQMDLGLSDWTVGMYVTPQSVSAGLQYFFGSSSANASTSGFRCFTGGVADPDGVFLRTLMGGDVHITGALAVGAVSHVAFVHDSSIPEVRGYLNGVLVTSVDQTTPGVGIFATTPDFLVMSYTAPVDMGNGMDDFRFYRRAISDGEVASWAACAGGPTLPTFCDPSDINSTGVPTQLSGVFTGAPGSGLHLEAAQGPAGQFGYCLIGTGSADPGLAVSQGHLCLSVAPGAQIGRYNIVGGVLNSVGQFDSAGILQNIVGTSAGGSGFDVPMELPFTGSPTIMSGETWHFQVWHRENGGQSNFSNGVTASF